MAATTTSIQGKYRASHGPFISLQQAADNIPIGAMVMINAAGFVSNAADTASTFFFGIAVEGSDYENPFSDPNFIMRLCYGLPVPDGWVMLESLFGKPVYDEKGRLKPEYIGLKRKGND